MIDEEKKKYIEALKEVTYRIADLYNCNLQLQIDVNVKLKQIKVKISETFS